MKNFIENYFLYYIHNRLDQFQKRKCLIKRIFVNFSQKNR